MGISVCYEQKKGRNFLFCCFVFLDFVFFVISPELICFVEIPRRSGLFSSVRSIFLVEVLYMENI